MAAMAAWVPMAMSMAGTLFQSMGAGGGMTASREAALRRQQQLEFEAKQLEINAGQERAAGQRVALDRDREARLVQSRALAVAGASGGGVSDPTIVNLIGKIAGEGAYRRGLAIYESEERARTLRLNAAARRYEGTLASEEGEVKASAYATTGLGALFKGAPGIVKNGMSLFDKYGGGGPGGSGSMGDSALIGGFGDGFGVSSVG